MKSFSTRLTAIALIVAMTLNMIGQTVLACPFCGVPTLTLTEQMAQADVTVIASFKTADLPAEDGSNFGSTIYTIEKIQLNPSKSALKKGDEIRIDRFQEGKAGDLAIMTGTMIKNAIENGTVGTLQRTNEEPVGRPTDLLWSSPLPITEAAIGYLDKLPPADANPIDRLEYFLNNLEAADPVVADDAYAEFAIAPYEQVVALAPRMKPEQLRGYINDKKTPVTRLGFYGLLMGLCGDKDDAKMMEERIRQTGEGFRIGIDGIMAGYLLLAGNEGLQVLADSKIKQPPAGQPDVPFSEIYAAMQALRFAWDFASPDQIDKTKLKETMRLFLDRPDMADLVINDLARWKDWGVADRLFAMFGQEDYDLPAVKKAIVAYFLALQDAGKETLNAPEAATVAKATAFIADLEKTDPKLLRHARNIYR
ncbi:hypothetical protein [Lacunimicrobium album]